MDRRARRRTEVECRHGDSTKNVTEADEAGGEEDLEQDIGEDQGEEGLGPPLEDVRFVEAAELDAVKKEIEELHRANGALQSLI